MVLLMSSAWAPVVHASDAPRSSDTTRLIDRIEKSRSGQTPADLSAARRLNADGDRAYKQRNYRAAFTAYSNSYPNSPNAYAYIMAGDAYWRGVVQYHEREARKPADGDAGCRVDNSHFAHDLATDVAQHHAVGFGACVARQGPALASLITLPTRARRGRLPANLGAALRSATALVVY